MSIDSREYEKAVYAGAQADYDQWRSVGPVELPEFENADPHIALVFTRRARLVVGTALNTLGIPVWLDGVEPS